MQSMISVHREARYCERSEPVSYTHLELKAQIKEHLEGLVGVVPGLIKAEVVTDLLQSSTRDLCLITLFLKVKCYVARSAGFICFVKG